MNLVHINLALIASACLIFLVRANARLLLKVPQDNGGFEDVEQNVATWFFLVPLGILIALLFPLDKAIPVNVIFGTMLYFIALATYSGFVLKSFRVCKGKKYFVIFLAISFAGLVVNAYELVSRWRA